MTSSPDTSASCERCGRDRGVTIRTNKPLTMTGQGRALTARALIAMARDQGAIISVICRDCEASDDK